MQLTELVNKLLDDTLQTSIPLYWPELSLCVTIVALLLVRVFKGGEYIPSVLLALGGSVAALYFALPLDGLETWSKLEPTELFTGMLVYDSLTAFIRVFLLAFAVLFIVLSWLTGIADQRDGQDYYVLVLGATLGMCIMASANHLLTIFLGVEMASVPSYVLAGIVKGRRRSSEAALKYAVYGAGTAGVMLYGISLLAGVLGTAHLPTIAQQLAALDIPAMTESGEQLSTVMVLVLGGLMIGVGLAFKLSAVPFHFWCPDVFEGASAEVGAFLSVASKAAAMALLLRVGLGLGAELPATQVDAGDTQILSSRVAEFTLVASEEASQAAVPPLAPVRRFFVVVVAIIAMITCTFGNLAAYGQENIKRLLAYSTIAHAGYMMMAAAAAVALVGTNVVDAQTAVSALLLYAAVYLFMNLGAFAIVAFLRNAMGSEEIADYAGIVRQCPMTTVAMTAILFSLVGLPPLAGFIGKFAIFRALLLAGGPLMITMLVVAGMNTAISLVYYLRVAKTMCIDSEPETRGDVSLGFLPATYVLLITLPVLIFGILPDWLAQWTAAAASQLIR